MPLIDAETPQPVAALPAPNPRNNLAMFKIFQNVQFNVVQHKKYVKEMNKLYKKLDRDEFCESFKNALYYLFTFGDQSANVDRVIQYVATFCASLDEEEEFLLFIFDIIFELQCVIGQSLRYRASQLLGAILTALGDDASLDDDLCDKLLASQMQRLQDQRGAVRCRAALALQRLQNPPDDDVTRAYRFHMSCDPSSSVRRAVLMAIAKTRHNVPFVLQRLCDVDEAVRRAAFLYMAAMPVTQLKVTQRVLTLKVGLTERSQRVRRVVEEILIPGWLSTFKGNIIDLLKAIRLDNARDAENSQYVAGRLLECLFRRLPTSELLEWLPTDKTLRLIPAERLNKETAWYWRHLVQHLQAVDDDETLEAILPDLVVLTGYIRAVVEAQCPSEAEDPVSFNTRQYVLHELATMLSVYDAADPASRTALQTLVMDTLTGDYGPLKPEVIRAFVKALEMIIPDVTQRVEIIYGVISSLRDPPEVEAPPPLPPAVDDTKVKLERARLRVSLNVAIEAQEEAVREQNYALAAECKEKVENIQKKLEELVAPPPPPPVVVPTIREKLSDPDTLNKCLTILNSALDTPQLTTITPMLRVIFNELEVEIFQNPDILENALMTVGLYGILDKEFAKDHKAFFVANLLDSSNEPVLATSLRCCVDLLCIHGALMFDENQTMLEDSKNHSKRKTRNSLDDDDEGTISESMLSPDNSSFIKLLLEITNRASATYRLIIVEGLCRLLYVGHLESPAIISRLLLLWFNPATVEEDELRQTIGVFFQNFPVMVDGAQDQIQKATIPTLKALANAPSNSPLAEIDQEAVVRFLVSLTRVSTELTDTQGAMAMLLSNHIVRRPNSPVVPLACRMLALLSPPREGRLACELATLLREVCDNLPDKQSARNLTRYLGALEAMESITLNKMSHTGITEGTMQNEDTMSMIQSGRATTSLPQPIARSTHVVINETVEEEVEIDETSPTEPMAMICEDAVEPNKEVTEPNAASSPRSSSGSDSAAAPESIDNPSDDSSGESPVKKAKVTKAKKKKTANTKQKLDGKKSEAKDKRTEEKQKEVMEKGIKRSRSQRSVEDIERAIKAKADSAKAKIPPSDPIPRFEDLDVSNVTIRKSRSLQSASSTESNGSSKNKEGKKGKERAIRTEAKATKSKKTPLSDPIPRFEDLDVSNVTVRKTRSLQSASSTESNGSSKNKEGKKGKEQANKSKPATRSSTGSNRSNESVARVSTCEDSADETELHTIVYDKEFEQSLLNESSELADSKRTSKSNVTIPETPDASEESESEAEFEPVKIKGKAGGSRK